MNGSNRYVIEFDDEAVGVVVLENEALTFHAVHPRVNALHGQAFDDAGEAERAVAAMMRSAA